VETRERPLSTADLAATSEKKARESQTAEERGPQEPESVIALGDAQTERPPNQDNGEELAPLFSESSVRDLRSQWSSLQTGFVDEPRRSVEQADQLVARVMKDLAETFSDERSKLERQWDQGDKISTEDLRLVLRRYRSFFDRFLSI
jgi:hypothetical protein